MLMDGRERGYRVGCVNCPRLYSIFGSQSGRITAHRQAFPPPFAAAHSHASACATHPTLVAPEVRRATAPRSRYGLIKPDEERIGAGTVIATT